MGKHIANLFVRAYAHLAESAHEVDERQAGSTPGMYRALVRSGAYLEADQFASLPMEARRKFCTLMASTAPLRSGKAEYSTSDVLHDSMRLFSAHDILKVCEGRALADERPLEKLLEPVVGDLEDAFGGVRVENEKALSVRSKDELLGHLRELRDAWASEGGDQDGLNLSIAQGFPASAHHWRKEIAEFLPDYDEFDDEYFEEPGDGGWDDVEYTGIEYDGEPDWVEEPEDEFGEQDEEPEDDEDKPEEAPAEEPEETDTGDVPDDGEPDEEPAEEPTEQDEEPGDDEEEPEDEPEEEEDVVHYMTYSQRVAGEGAEDPIDYYKELGAANDPKTGKPFPRPVEQDDEEEPDDDEEEEPEEEPGEEEDVGEATSDFKIWLDRTNVATLGFSRDDSAELVAAKVSTEATGEPAAFSGETVGGGDVVLRGRMKAYPILKKYLARRKIQTYECEKGALGEQTRWNKGDRVKSNVTAQGLKKGEEYTVVDMDEMRTPFGTFVTYHVTDKNGKKIAVGNGHLVLQAAESTVRTIKVIKEGNLSELYSVKDDNLYIVYDFDLQAAGVGNVDSFVERLNRKGAPDAYVLNRDKGGMGVVGYIAAPKSQHKKVIAAAIAMGLDPRRVQEGAFSDDPNDDRNVYWSAGALNDPKTGKPFDRDTLEQDEEPGGEPDDEEPELMGGPEEEAAQSPVEAWGVTMKTDPKERGKHADKTVAQLRSQLKGLKAKGPHSRESKEYGLMKELQFAIRAKTGWGKVGASVEKDSADLAERKAKLGKLTMGMMHAFGRQIKARHVCAECGMAVPIYAGRYPAACPNCGAAYTMEKVAKPKRSRRARTEGVERVRDMILFEESVARLACPRCGGMLGEGVRPFLAETDYDYYGTVPIFMLMQKVSSVVWEEIKKRLQASRSMADWAEARAGYRYIICSDKRDIPIVKGILQALGLEESAYRIVEQIPATDAQGAATDQTAAPATEEPPAGETPQSKSEPPKEPEQPDKVEPEEQGGEDTFNCPSCGAEIPTPVLKGMLGKLLHQIASQLEQGDKTDKEPETGAEEAPKEEEPSGQVVPPAPTPSQAGTEEKPKESVQEFNAGRDYTQAKEQAKANATVFPDGAVKEDPKKTKGMEAARKESKFQPLVGELLAPADGIPQGTEVHVIDRKGKTAFVEHNYKLHKVPAKSIIVFPTGYDLESCLRAVQEGALTRNEAARRRLDCRRRARKLSDVPETKVNPRARFIAAYFPHGPAAEEVCEMLSRSMRATLVAEARTLYVYPKTDSDRAEAVRRIERAEGRIIQSCIAFTYDPARAISEQIDGGDENSDIVKSVNDVFLAAYADVKQMRQMLVDAKAAFLKALAFLQGAGVGKKTQSAIQKLSDKIDIEKAVKEQTRMLEEMNKAHDIFVGEFPDAGKEEQLPAAEPAPEEPPPAEEPPPQEPQAVAPGEAPPPETPQAAEPAPSPESAVKEAVERCRTSEDWPLLESLFRGGEAYSVIAGVVKDVCPELSPVEIHEVVHQLV